MLTAKQPSPANNNTLDTVAQLDNIMLDLRWHIKTEGLLEETFCNVHKSNARDYRNKPHEFIKSMIALIQLYSEASAFKQDQLANVVKLFGEFTQILIAAAGKEHDAPTFEASANLSEEEFKEKTKKIFEVQYKLVETIKNLGNSNNAVGRNPNSAFNASRLQRSAETYAESGTSPRQRSPSP